MKVWLNGALLPVEEARISPLDRGFLYGDGLFETLRAYRGRPFLLEEHLTRLAEGCATLGFPAPDSAALHHAVAAVLTANGLLGDDARVRITLTRGAGDGDLWPDEPAAPTVLVVAQPVSFPPWLGAGGGAAAILATARVPSGFRSAKSTSFQPHVVAKGEARRAGAWEALLRNERGEIAEGATSNVFALLDGRLVTPPLDSGCLAGLTRATILAIAGPALCLDVLEAPLRVEDLERAREVFLSSSIAEIVPLVRLDGLALGDGAVGPVTRAVRDAYRAEVRRALDAA